MSENRPRVAVVGSINTDLVVYAPRLPQPGETVIGSDLLTGGGGKGANQAVAAARLGCDVRLLGRIGDDDFGRAARAGLGSAGVDVDLIYSTAHAPSGVALIVVDDKGENQIALAPGANGHVTPADVDAAWPVLGSCAVMLLQLEVPIETVTRAAVRARESGLRVILNPAPASREPLPPELLAAVDVIVPNEHEASAMTNLRVVDRLSAAEAARRLCLQGPRAAIVTLGAEGALVLMGGHPQHIQARKVEVVDSTAAGDAFCGGLAFALARGESLSAAAELATRVAALAVTRPGAQSSMPTFAELTAHP